MEEKYNKDEYFELHKHDGTADYEVAEILPKEYSMFEEYAGHKPDMFLDNKEKDLIVCGYEKLELEDKYKYKRFRVSKFGEIKDEGSIYRVLKNGTLWSSQKYCNWIINGDKTIRKYLDPFSGKEVVNPYDFKLPEENPTKWLNKFQEFYEKASYVYVYLGFYYFNIDGMWYLIRTPRGKLEEKLKIENFKKKYPAKETDIRMLELESLEKDTSIIRKIDFDATYIKKRKGFGIRPSSTYAAGWWYLNIKMPGGDIIKMKHYAPYMRPDVYLYRIPEEYEGRPDVLFVVQKPNPMFTEQAAGMYVIRPRNYKESEDYKETCSRQ